MQGDDSLAKTRRRQEKGTVLSVFASWREELTEGFGLGINAYEVEVEADLSGGQPFFA